MSVFSLPTQRCFRVSTHHHRKRDLFSAYAEVFLTAALAPTVKESFLCLRRGVSSDKSLSFLASGFSLPTQRCFSLPGSAFCYRQLFSAYAEVFPRDVCCYMPFRPFLCLRRGVSLKSNQAFCVRIFSLPTQRCFLKPEEVKGFWSAFLCLRRGVSLLSDKTDVCLTFSLPTQRCFQLKAYI